MAVPEKIELSKIEVEERRILRLIGYKKPPAEIKPSLRELIDREKKELASLLQPASIYTIIDYEETNKHPIFEMAEKVALCICTIGSAVEAKIAELVQDNEITRALVLDAFASEATEEVARRSDRILSRKARALDLWPSKRFSPGYKPWPLTEQKFIFSLLPGEEIGVKLNPHSCMMVPRKSISFRINFYKDKNLTTRKKI
ncbi:MAG: hypothetical protein JRI84_07115 [Deltaproteobacteria bacterium]|nr:hypothetical protein [Deltaproteobacteria bacterium]